MKYFSLTLWAVALLCIANIISGCAAHSETVPVVYFDCDMTTGVYTDQYWFEGELAYSDDGTHSGYVVITKFIGTSDNSKDGYESFYSWYKNSVDWGEYDVVFDDGPVSWYLRGYGAGPAGIIVSPAFLPDVNKIAKQLKLKEK